MERLGIRGGRRLAAAAAAAAVVVSAAAAPAAQDETRLLSRAGNVKGNGASVQVAISAEGTRAAFASDAPTLHPDDNDTVRDVFANDLETGAITLVSRASAGVKGTADSVAPALSATGRYVAFASDAQLHADDTDLNSDIYVRDLTAGTTVLASRSSAGTKGNADSEAPAISADGRYVAFQSDAKLHADDGDNLVDVYRRDLGTGTTVLVSRASASAGGADGTNFSELPSISGDGRLVSFESIANNLDPADPDTTRDVYVRDVDAATTTLVSRATGAAGAKANGASLRSALSADGRYVAFDSQASNLDPLDGTTPADVYVRDLQTSTTTLVSRASGAGGAKANGAALRAAISGDGRYVAFDSVASNLDPDDPTGTSRDVFVRDLVAHTTLLVSRAGGATGAKGNGDSSQPAISATGRWVAFESLATNLDPLDGDAISDVFARDVLGPPDTTPPTIDAPAEVTVEATGPGGALVTYTATAGDNVAVATFGCTPASGATFPIGATTVTCTATDTSANTKTVTFLVTVVDRQPPAITVPSALSVQATGADGAPVSYDASASDAVGVTSFACVPATGATFAVGTTTVTCSAADAAGNTASASFTVTVQAPPAPGPGVVRSTAKIGVSRATIIRGRRLLDVAATISPLASGSIDVEFRAAGHTVRVSAPIRSGRMRIRKRLTKALAAAGRGVLTLRYAGDPDTRPKSVRLQTGRRPPTLRLKRPQLVQNGSLTASGTVHKAARGSVRLELEYEYGGQTKIQAFSAPIARGAWRLNVQLPAAVAAEIAERTGTVDAYAVFEGYAPRGMRGDVRWAEVLGPR